MTGTPLSWAYFATIVLISIGISSWSTTRSNSAMRSFRKATSSGVMVMFAPGTTRMRFSVPPFGCSSRMMTEQPEAALSS